MGTTVENEMMIEDARAREDARVRKGIDFICFSSFYFFTYLTYL
jgi:hypothetical protein